MLDFLPRIVCPAAFAVGFDEAGGDEFVELRFEGGAVRAGESGGLAVGESFAGAEQGGERGDGRREFYMLDFMLGFCLRYQTWTSARTLKLRNMSQGSTATNHLAAACKTQHGRICWS